MERETRARIRKRAWWQSPHAAGVHWRGAMARAPRVFPRNVAVLIQAAGLQAEVGRADLVVAEEVSGGALHGDAAVFDDVAAVGDGEAVDDVLLDDEDGDAALADVLDAGEDLLGDLGGQAEGRFVEEEEARGGHEAARDGDHLLLAA